MKIMQAVDSQNFVLSCTNTNWKKKKNEQAMNFLHQIWQALQYWQDIINTKLVHASYSQCVYIHQQEAYLHNT